MIDSTAHCRRRLAVLVAAGSLAIACGAGGCSGRRYDKWRDGLPPAHPAGGTVTYQGRPLGQATVVFLADVPGKDRSLAAVALTDAAGRFRLRTYRDGDGAIAGTHRVTVRRMVVTTPGGKPLVPNASGDILDLPTEKHLIPEKYASPETSGLSATVSAGGTNEFSFALE